MIATALSFDYSIHRTRNDNSIELAWSCILFSYMSGVEARDEEQQMTNSHYNRWLPKQAKQLSPPCRAKFCFSFSPQRFVLFCFRFLGELCKDLTGCKDIRQRGGEEDDEQAGAAAFEWNGEGNWIFPCKSFFLTCAVTVTATEMFVCRRWFLSTRRVIHSIRISYLRGLFGVGDDDKDNINGGIVVTHHNHFLFANGRRAEGGHTYL